MKRKTVVALAALAALAGATSIALATIPGANGVISGCYNKASGLLRVVDAEAGESCGAAEQAIQWNQTGPQGPPGPAGAPGTAVVGFRAIRTNQVPGGGVEITARGTGDFGFPAEGETASTVLRLNLPAGKYLLTTRLGVEKNGGAGELVCYVRAGASFVTAFLRVALGTDAGASRMTTVAGDGFYDTETAGPQAVLECVQAANVAAPTGPNPFVFYATITATSVAQFTGVPGGN